MSPQPELRSATGPSPASASQAAVRPPRPEASTTRAAATVSPLARTAPSTCAVAQQPPAKAEEVVWLAELGHTGPLPTLEHLAGVAYRAVRVAFHQHHVMTGAARGQGGGQARQPATQHEQLHGLHPEV